MGVQGYRKGLTDLACKGAKPAEKRSEAVGLGRSLSFRNKEGREELAIEVSLRRQGKAAHLRFVPGHFLIEGPGRPGPTPDDAAQLEEAREVELQTMLATLTRFEFVNATVGVPELAAALASWAASAGEKERESTGHEETNPSIIYRTKHHEALLSKSRTG